MKRFLILAGVVMAIALAVGLPLFEPWRAFTSSTIDEAAPMSTPSVAGSSEPSAQVPTTPADTVLTSGEFVDAEHGTSGTAKILQLADGRRYLRLERLSSSDGPDLHVWLSDAKSGGGWARTTTGRTSGSAT